MTVRPVRLFGDPVLVSEAQEVTEFDAGLQQLVADMFETMAAEEGVGLAANQVGVLKRVFVYNDGEKQGVVINPKWKAIGEDTVEEQEGCLSIPGVFADVQRHAKVAVTGFDEHGNEIEFEADGLLSRCVQHETDHLDGVLFLRRLTGDRRKEAMATLRKQEWFA